MKPRTGKPNKDRARIGRAQKRGTQKRRAHPPSHRPLQSEARRRNQASGRKRKPRSRGVKVGFREKFRFFPGFFFYSNEVPDIVLVCPIKKRSGEFETKIFETTPEPTKQKSSKRKPSDRRRRFLRNARRRTSRESGFSHYRKELDGEGRRNRHRRPGPHGNGLVFRSEIPKAKINWNSRRIFYH